MSGWQNVEHFVLLTPVCSENYVQILDNLQREHKNCQVDGTPNTPDLAYYSNVVLQDDSSARAIWHIAITVYVVIALLQFVGPAAEAALGVAQIFPGLHRNGKGGLVSFLFRIHLELNDICFL